MNLAMVNNLWAVMQKGEGNQYQFGAENQYTLTVARSPEERRQAWARVYQSYREQGYVAEKADGLWCNLHDALPSTTTFFVSRGDTVVGALSVVFDSPFRLPADELYHAELDVLRAKGRRLCEIISLANDDKEGRGCLEILKEMFRMAYLTARKEEGCTDIVITVNPHHVAYYERRLMFDRAGEERRYEKVAGAPAVLLALDLTTAEERYIAAYGTKENSLFRHFCLRDNEAGLCRMIREGRRPEMLLALAAWFRAYRPFIWNAARTAWNGVDSAGAGGETDAQLLDDAAMPLCNGAVAGR